ncbi:MULTISPECIES: type VI secretion system protein TssA [Lelliottia]|uniref:Type VI secretion system ImpA family N-terminal domain-containing protein n=1 Tax=Lelliottia wanjuensis TaxID=3050585 RepID=A0AAP4D0D4_9ENTR|nr:MULTISPECIES: type VI secretion system ImpA family N-terminal domain-containing protein [unclassified Lelliottia]MDK9361830.1 type VI secretion system ImpA family N-terminal domain-containing protein [Lelliottia sp. V106_12]MDK9582982.1 type VI secretion system ImpA family N-terminal domain-containing protein [Lelliottia sp. V86_10]MDK9618559.1 type VI secretion system ImpA family N-terminal domain-containing protein [Lelliottia sp. V106_9]
MDYYQHLLEPIPGPSPCGEDLEYNPAFVLLQSRLQPRLEAEYGQFTETANPVNWADIERDCHALLAKSRDIRLIIILIRCRLRTTGLRALSEGFQALLALLQQWPNELYPLLHDEGEFEPLLRANALNELDDHSGLLNDIRHYPLPKVVGTQCLVKDIERALAIPRDESALPEATVQAMQNAWRDGGDNDIASLSQARLQLQTLSALLADSLGDSAPGFLPTLRLLALFTDPEVTPASEPALPIPAPPSAPESTPVYQPATVAQASPAKEITSRAQAFATLNAVQAWFMGAEPGSPVILLLDFAIKTSGKTFSELLQLLPVEIVAHLTNEGKE